MLVGKLTATTEDNIYFCLSRQRLNAGQRDRANATGLSALWLDVDVEPDDPNKYSNAGGSHHGDLRVLRLLEIPYPSIIVWRGGGLHCYWLSDRS